MQYEDRRNRGNQKNETKIFQLEWMYWAKGNKITSKTKSFKYYQNEGSFTCGRRTLYGLLVSRLQSIWGLLQNERERAVFHLIIN